MVSKGSAFLNPYMLFIHQHDVTSITVATGIQMRWMHTQWPPVNNLLFCFIGNRHNIIFCCDSPWPRSADTFIQDAPHTESGIAFYVSLLCIITPTDKEGPLVAWTHTGVLLVGWLDASPPLKAMWWKARLCGDVLSVVSRLWRVVTLECWITRYLVAKEHWRKHLHKKHIGLCTDTSLQTPSYRPLHHPVACTISHSVSIRAGFKNIRWQSLRPAILECNSER